MPKPPAAARAGVHYEVVAAHLQAHLFQVTLTIAQPQAQQTVSLPVWIPGSYLVREFAKNLQNLRARQSGRALELQQLTKARWQVELFFKWIKQNLKIKSFIGTSKNAVMTQIWIAMCVYLLLAFIKFQSKMNKTMQQILRLLQLNLFEKRDLMALLRGDPPNLNYASDIQMSLL